MNVFRKFSPDVVQLLQGGAIGVVPTDTLYGVVASAGNEAAVNQLYVVKRRQPHKACIILAADVEDVTQWVRVTLEVRSFLNTYWPGPVSVALPLTDKAPSYLYRGEMSLAIRVPADPELRAFLAQTGPLVAPSANPEGEPPAETLAQAQNYFGEMVRFYVDGGDLGGNQPSTIVTFRDDKPVVLRGQLPAKDISI